MAITTALCTSFKEEILLGEHNLTSHDFKIAIYSSAATLGAATTAYSATNEITGTGYTAGGSLLTGASVTTSSTTAIVDFADVSWAAASFTGRGCEIYNNTHASDAAVSVHDFGSDKTVTEGTFTLQFPTADISNAIIRIA